MYEIWNNVDFLTEDPSYVHRLLRVIENCWKLWASNTTCVYLWLFNVHTCVPVWYVYVCASYKCVYKRCDKPIIMYMFCMCIYVYVYVYTFYVYICTLYTCECKRPCCVGWCCQQLMRMNDSRWLSIKQATGVIQYHSITVTQKYSITVQIQ